MTEITTNLDKLTKHEYEQIGRIYKQLYPEIVQELETLYTPALTNQVHIKEIHNRIISTYPDLEQYDRNVLITACIYSLYAPAALIGCQNAPAGLRRILADLMGYQNGSNINYWLEIAKAHIKSARYIKKVNSITDHFKNL